MKKVIFFLSILMVILALGAVGCDLLDTDDGTPNCKAVCEIIIDDCGFASETGLPGEDVSECVEMCVDENDGDDLDSDDREDVEDMSCMEIEAFLESEMGAESYPNCVDACEIIIDDCDLGTISGPPGSTVQECAESCVENYGYEDMYYDDYDYLMSLSTCDEVEEWISG